MFNQMCLQSCCTYTKHIARVVNMMTIVRKVACIPVNAMSSAASTIRLRLSVLKDDGGLNLRPLGKLLTHEGEMAKELLLLACQLLQL